MSLFGTEPTCRRSRLMSVVGAGTDLARTRPEVSVCEGFRMPARDDGATDSGGRRPQTSKGGNRGGCGGVVRQALWGFGHCRSFAEVGWQLFRQAIAGATKRVSRLQWAESELRGGNGTTRRLS